MPRKFHLIPVSDGGLAALRLQVGYKLPESGPTVDTVLGVVVFSAEDGDIQRIKNMVGVKDVVEVPVARVPRT